MSAADFPAMRAHEGVWEGTYRHFTPDGRLEDQHAARVSCAFPSAGGVFYRQSIRFTWQDGRERRETFEGVVREGAVWFDAPRFSGRSWESEGIVLLHLTRKDEPDAEMFEMITLLHRRAERSDARPGSMQSNQNLARFPGGEPVSTSPESALGQDGDWRARTWHWFKGGRLLRRTLCDERRVSRTPDSQD